MANSLEEVLENAFKSMLADIEIGLPAVVNSYDYQTQTVTATPAPRTPRGEALPAIADIPVQFAGGGGYAISFPLVAGDPVWLAFSGRGFGGYIESGSTAAEETFKQRFSLGSCVAFPNGPRPKNNTLASASPTALVIGEDAPGGATIRIDGGKIELGTAAGGVVDLLEQVVDQLLVAVTATVTGPQPLANILGPLGTIKTAIIALKGS